MITQPQMMNQNQWNQTQNNPYASSLNPGHDGYDPSGYNNYTNSFQSGGNAFTDAYSQGGQLPGQGYVAPEFGKIKDAGLFGVNQAASLYGDGGNTRDFGQDSLNSQDMIRNMAGGSNPVTGAINAVQGIQDGSNSFMQGFNGNPYQSQLADFGAQQNQYLDGMYDQGADKIQDRMNSMFGMAGRGQSGAHAKLTGDTLQNFGTNLYGGAFDSMQNRNLSGMQSASNSFDAGLNRNLQGAGLQLNAAGMMPGLNTAQYGNAAMMEGLGDRIDAQNYDNSNSGWNNLQNYSNIVGQLQGTQPPDRPKSSSFDKLLGLGSIGASLYSGGLFG